MSETPRPEPQLHPRGRGAPKGNHNALKFGFYSPRFPPPQPDPGQEPPQCPGDLHLTDEIALLRLYIARVVDLTPPDEDLNSARDTLRLLCVASTAIARLARAQFIVYGKPEDDLSEEIGRIVDEMRAELASRPPHKTRLDPGCDPLRAQMGLPLSTAAPQPDPPTTKRAKKTYKHHTRSVVSPEVATPRINSGLRPSLEHPPSCDDPKW